MGYDGRTLTHITEVSTSNGSHPLTSTDAAKPFQTTLKSRVETPPKASWLMRVGNYGVFED